MKTELWYALVGASEYPVIYCPCHSAHENTRGKDRHAISSPLLPSVSLPSLLSSTLRSSASHTHAMSLAVHAPRPSLAPAPHPPSPSLSTSTLPSPSPPSSPPLPARSS